jgi:nucleotide-binding universal stress UspA family protein
MPTHELTSFTAGHLRAGTLLFVTDPVKDRQNVLEFVCALAERHGAHLELVHVIDPEHISSLPDTQICIQYRLEALAWNMRRLQGGAGAILLFGKPERVLAERAGEIRATLIAIALNGSATDHIQKRLAEDLSRKCDCPVLTLPPDARVGGPQSVFDPGSPERRLVS